MPPRNILPQLLELLLETLAENIDVVGRAIVDAPDEEGSEKRATGPSRQEPDRARDHRRQRVQVLNDHKRWLLLWLGKAQHQFSDPSLGVRLEKVRETGRPPRSDLVGAAHSDHDVVRQLPDDVGQSGPDHHGGKRVVPWIAWVAEFDRVHGIEALLQHLDRGQMHNAVQSDWWDDVDEGTANVSGRINQSINILRT